MKETILLVTNMSFDLPGATNNGRKTSNSHIVIITESCTYVMTDV